MMIGNDKALGIISRIDMDALQEEDRLVFQEFVNRLEYLVKKDEGVKPKRIAYKGKKYDTRRQCGNCGTVIPEAWYTWCPNCGYRIKRLDWSEKDERSRKDES